MPALKLRDMVMAAAFLGASATAVSVHAIGCSQGRYAMSPVAPPPAMGMTPYGMRGNHGYAPPMPYGRGGPMIAYGAYGQAPQMQMTGQSYGYPSSASTKPAKSASTAAGGGEVSISQMRFEPATFEIKAGETVIWRNNGAGTPHTVSARGEGGPQSGTLGSGQAFSHTFDESGTYEYYCALHPGMTGTVIVQ